MKTPFKSTVVALFSAYYVHPVGFHEHTYMPSHMVRMLMCMRIPKYLRVAHMCVRIPVAMPAAPIHLWWRLLSPLIIIGAILTLLLLE